MLDDNSASLSPAPRKWKLLKSLSMDLDFRFKNNSFWSTSRAMQHVSKTERKQKQASFSFITSSQGHHGFVRSLFKHCQRNFVHSSYRSIKWYSGSCRFDYQDLINQGLAAAFNAASGMFIALVIQIPAVTAMTLSAHHDVEGCGVPISDLLSPIRR